MANRSYLYSTDTAPSPDSPREGRKLVGIAEWNYDIPLAFKLLLSGDTKCCRSSIWEVDEEIALIGSYEKGFAALKQFLRQIDLAVAQPLIAEAIEFLEKEKNRNTFFILECGEIFEMEEEPLQEQNMKLLAQIQNLDAATMAAVASLNPPPAVPSTKSLGLLSKIFGSKPTAQSQPIDPMKAIYALGLGNWSNVLYFDFSDA